MVIFRRLILGFALLFTSLSARAASYGIVAETSPAARTQLDTIIALADELIDAQADDDRALVISVAGGEVTLQQGLTTDKEKLHDATGNLFIENKPWLPLDALYLAAGELDEGDLLVLLSSGSDQGSHYSVAQLAALLAEKKIRLRVIGFGPNEAAKKFLTELATAAGGRSSFPVSASDRQQVLQEIIATLHARKGA
jgi:hypothetical protein